MLDFGKHTVFILAAYGISLTALAGLLIYTLRGRND